MFSEWECSQMRGQMDVWDCIDEAEKTAPAPGTELPDDGTLFALRLVDNPTDDGALFGIGI